MQVTNPFHSMILRYSFPRGIEYIQVIYLPLLFVSSKDLGLKREQMIFMWVFKTNLKHFDNGLPFNSKIQIVEYNQIKPLKILQLCVFSLALFFSDS